MTETKMGTPVKIDMRKNIKNSQEFLYGRYYGESKTYWPNGDEGSFPNLIAITPDGLIVKGGEIYFELIEKEEDLSTLRRIESSVSNPYEPYMIMYEDEFVSTGEYERLPITINQYPSKWYEDNGYLDIEQKLFGEALAALFSHIFKARYYYQQIRVEHKSGVKYTATRASESRYMSLLSQEIYSEKDFYHEKDYPIHRRNRWDDTNAFNTNPVEIKEGDFLLYFGHYSSDTAQSTINLGHIEKGHFIPNNFNPIKDASHSAEVNFNNPQVDVIDDFMRAIFEYKLNNRKPKLERNDLEIILENFGISRKEKMQTLLATLRVLQDTATISLMENCEIGKSLQLRK